MPAGATPLSSFPGSQQMLGGGQPYGNDMIAMPVPSGSGQPSILFNKPLSGTPGQEQLLSRPRMPAGATPLSSFPGSLSGQPGGLMPGSTGGTYNKGFWDQGGPIQLPNGGTINPASLTQAEYNALSGLRAGNPVGGPFAQAILEDLQKRGIYVPGAQGGGEQSQALLGDGSTNTPPPSAPSMPFAQADPFSKPTSAMDVYRSSVPVMQDAMEQAVGDAMATAGFSGNRFGSYAMDTAAKEGTRAGLAQNQLLTDLLYRQTNTDLDRALQAAGLATSQEQAANQMNLDRMRFLGDMGKFEQGRQDQYGLLQYQDFENNKMGWLPFLMQLAQSPGMVTQGQWGTQQTGGSPGLIDYAKLAAQLYGTFSDG